MEYSFPHYLLSKQSVDDRALNKDVLNALKASLPQQPIRIIEVGAGIGTMLRRLMRWDVIHHAEYVLADEMAENIEAASEWIPQFASAAGLSVDRIEQNQVRVFDETHDVRIRLERADVFDFIQKNKEPADLLIAHAFLDMLPMPESLPNLLSLTTSLAWLTINFDGMTSLEPTIDAALDEQIERGELVYIAHQMDFLVKRIAGVFRIMMYGVIMIYTYEIEGIPVQTGDIICTMNGKPNILPGEFWRFVGRLVPGDVDHVAIYLGPEGRCVEAGGLGVITFDVKFEYWETERMARQRGLLFDTFYGVVSPLDALGLAEEEEHEMREKVAAYCLAQVGKRYNLNFFNAETEDAFYCSQLAYKAYQQIGIDLNTGLEMEQLRGTNAIIYPQEIWNGFSHRAVKHDEHTIGGQLTIDPSR